MNEINLGTIQRFYTAFQQLDAAGMNSCYAADIMYSDPVYGLLRGEEVHALWEMTCRDVKDFSLRFSNITSDDDEYYTCDWQMTYLYPPTGRRVVSNGKAYMQLNNGVIAGHSDGYKYYRWCRQAYGLTGLVFGWSGFMHKRVRRAAIRRLNRFMEQ
jgi:hypothetical protein